MIELDRWAYFESDPPRELPPLDGDPTDDEKSAHQVRVDRRNAEIRAFTKADSKSFGALFLCMPEEELFHIEPF